MINLKISVNAHKVNALPEEITAIMSIANYKESVLRSEKLVDVMHCYSLAASKLNSLREKCDNIAAR
ncbi:hypothetical protein [Arsenophonus endosymbiont of Aleurodicus dispersus]|uniref:hypothetical protein n=1 Tax=Arsenophonus endosymbiont of Aleurodicus dispersus TaxID=235559 RepID=UPI002111C13B|nr:hypothetical protein [Arsenophonus endosymbiont of Aleurodicus dispersus]